MTRGLGFDGDSAYHESLEAAVRASESQKNLQREEGQKERRKSLGLPEDGTYYSLFLLFPSSLNFENSPFCVPI